jgi:hypothetical protein
MQPVLIRLSSGHLQQTEQLALSYMVRNVELGENLHPVGIHPLGLRGVLQSTVRHYRPHIPAHIALRLQGSLGPQGPSTRSGYEWGLITHHGRLGIHSARCVARDAGRDNDERNGMTSAGTATT